MSVIKKNPAVSEQVTDYLKKQIRDGSWEPGSRISSENELTKALGVSRASVRSGIKQLEAIGILESRQGKGTFVRSIPAQDISEELNRLYKENKDVRDLFEYRMILETECCRLVVDRLKDNDFTEMRKYLERMRAEFRKGETRSGEVFADCDFGFHRQIYIATGNQLVIDSMKRIGRETEQYQSRFNTDFLAERAVYYHERIIRAFEAGDGSSAAEEMRQHLSLALKEYDRLLNGEQSGNAAVSH